LSDPASPGFFFSGKKGRDNSKVDFSLIKRFRQAGKSAGYAVSERRKTFGKIGDTQMLPPKVFSFGEPT
jgi:hypothetical protein